MIHQNLLKKGDLANLKSNVDKLDIDKLKNVPTDLSYLKNKIDKLLPALIFLSKLSDVVEYDVVKKDVHNAKIKNIKDKIPDITDLAPTTALTAVEKKIHNVSNLVKKTDYNTKISELENKVTTDHDHDKYITTQEVIKLAILQED